jgi:hypothetical protein
VADIAKLKGITPAEAGKLRAAQVKTVEQLWLRISEEGDNGISGVSNASELSKDRLMELLTAEILRPAGRFGTGWLKEHWPDLIVMTAILLLIGIAWYRMR